MYVAYNGTKIIPGPFVKFTTEINRTEDGQKVGKNLVATLTGRFLHGKGGATHTGPGYPADDYSLCSLDDLLSKQQDLRNLFATDNMWFEIQPDPEATAQVHRWVAKVRSIDFPEGLLNPVCDYTVTLELQHATWDGIQGIEETWELTEQDSPRDTYSLIHKIACTSREEYDTVGASVTDGWKKALDHIVASLGGMGIDGGIVYNDPGLDLSVAFTEYNHRVTKVLDEANGKYNITETWIMSEDAYTEDQTFSAEYDRDGPGGHNWKIGVEGTITGLDTGDVAADWATVTSRWNSVKSGLFASLSDILAETGSPTVTLRTEPSSKRVTHNQPDRVISYSYTYDEGTTNCNEDISVTVSKNETDCDVWSVTVEGTITGHRDGTDTAYTIALACYGALDIDTLANTAYTNSGGVGTLIGPNISTIRHNEYNGVVGFSAVYHDRATVYRHEKTISSQFTRDNDVTTVTIEGTIGTDCGGTWGDVTTELAAMDMATAYLEANALYAGYHALCEFADSYSSTRNEIGLTANYSYTFSDDKECSADVSQSVTVKQDPENCGKQLVTVDGSVTGRRTTSATPWTNANTEYTTNHSESDIETLIAAYVSGTTYRQAKSVTYSERSFQISYNYEYTNQGAYKKDETVTEAWGEECGTLRITQEGTITGLCTGAAGSAYSNANTGYGSVSDPSGAINQVRQSVSRNEERGTISYSREFDDRSNPYTIEYTDTTREDNTGCYKTVIIDGSVQGICSSNVAGSAIVNADAGFGSLSLSPSTSSATGWWLKSQSVGRNTFSGKITFSYEYAEKSACITDAISESVEVSDEAATDVFAVVNVLGAPAVIQDKGGTSAKKRTITIQVQIAPDCTTCTAGIGGGPDVSSIVNGAEPSAAVVLVASDTTSWNPRTGRYTRSKSWVYGDC
jgi:hypothetical protein